MKRLFIIATTAAVLCSACETTQTLKPMPDDTQKTAEQARDVMATDSLQPEQPSPELPATEQPDTPPAVSQTPETELLPALPVPPVLIEPLVRDVPPEVTDDSTPHLSEAVEQRTDSLAAERIPQDALPPLPLPAVPEPFPETMALDPATTTAVRVAPQETLLAADELSHAAADISTAETDGSADSHPPELAAAAVAPAEQEMPPEAVDDDARTETVPVPSRSVIVDNGAYIDVVYPGGGWTYLGETDGKQLLVFLGRTLGEADTAFTLRARSSGITVVHFYKNDVLTGEYIDDYMAVTVSEQLADGSVHILAPSYAETVPPRPVLHTEPTADTFTTELAAGAHDATDSAVRPHETNRTAPPLDAPQEPPDAAPRTVIQPAEPSVRRDVATAPQTDIPVTGITRAEPQYDELPAADELLERARQAYRDAQYRDALSLIEQFFTVAVTRIDEGLYVQGQILEAHSDVRDIKAAIDSYLVLLNNWPASTLWNDAQRRYTYLKRFYIDIY
ncbi:MAG: hypothetical protein IJ191_02855 [Treponema sp.]|nr:hypothetical protein [Treponema sp.]